MSENTSSDSELIAKILETAQRESREIIEEADRTIAERRTSLEQRVRRIEKDARQRLEQESSEIRRRAETAVALAESRAELRRENRLLQIVESRTVAKIAAMRDDPEYASVLQGWLVEAATGLGAEHARVTCPDADREIVHRVLDEAREVVEREHGLAVKLELDQETTVGGQGVVLTSVPRRTAFSNTVADRMRRHRSDIRRIVYEIVIEDEHERSDHR